MTRQKVLERDVVTAIRNLLDIHQMRGALVYKRINTGAKLRNIRRRIVFTKNTDMIGMSDIILWIKNGPGGVCWEIKLPEKSAKQSEDQQKFESEILRVGHEYYVLRSLDEAILMLKSYGVT